MQKSSVFRLETALPFATGSRYGNMGRGRAGPCGGHVTDTKRLKRQQKGRLMKTKIAFVLLTLAFTPSFAMAACQGDAHAQTTMSCGDGKVLDAATKACVPVTG